MAVYTMPFGKYQGQPLEALDDQYLFWVASLEHLRDPLLTYIQAEINRRLAAQTGNGDLTFSIPERVVLERLITSGYRALARRAHPDVGGDHAAMVAVNTVYARLRLLLKFP